MKNIKKNEKIICMMLEDVSSDFSRELVKSLANAIPSNRKIRLIVLPGKHDDGKDEENLHRHKTVVNKIFSLSERCDIDGFVIHLGSVNERDKNTPGLYESFMSKIKKVPVVLVASDLKNVITVNYDNESGIREAIEYIANAQGLTKICMLGGRDDNKDARARKQIFIKCLKDYRLQYSEDQFEPSDMTENSEEAAERLLDRNPDVQAIFCVNDSSAKGLYKVLKARDKKIGSDVMVFGFDNTRMSSNLDPPLSSVGADKISLGRRALELLLEMMEGNEVSSDTVPTRLFGRASMPYEMYDYNTIELTKAETSFIYRMFNDCFHRYRLESIDTENVDLKRLFFEFMSPMLISCKHRYMSLETYDELCRMIDKFFDKGAMQYTDSNKLIASIGRVQIGINNASHSQSASTLINRLFSRMKDRAIVTQAKALISREREHTYSRIKLQEFIVSAVGGNGSDSIFRSFDKLGLPNAAVYIFDKPLDLGGENNPTFPEYIYLKCIMRSGDLYMLSEDRQKCRTADIFLRNELSVKSNGYITFPILCGSRAYGLLMCEISDEICENGEFIALELGMSLALKENSP